MLLVIAQGQWTHPLGFPGGSDGKEFACNVGYLCSITGLRRSLWGGHGNPLQYSCLENPHGQRCPAGYSLRGSEEWDMTEWLSTAQQAQWGLSPSLSNLALLPLLLLWLLLPFSSLGRQEWKASQTERCDLPQSLNGVLSSKLEVWPFKC